MKHQHTRESANQLPSSGEAVSDTRSRRERLHDAASAGLIAGAAAIALYGIGQDTDSFRSSVEVLAAEAKRKALGGAALAMISLGITVNLLKPKSNAETEAASVDDKSE